MPCYIDLLSLKNKIDDVLVDTDHLTVIYEYTVHKSFEHIEMELIVSNE